MQSSPKGRRYENLKSVLVKLTNKNKRTESQSIGKEKKILIPKISHGVITMWAHKPNAKLAK